MAEKKETLFSRKLHDKLIPQVYVEKTSNPWRAGIPDFYYETAGNILWAEHKWMPKPWTKIVSCEDICKGSQWPRQRAWLNRAHGNQISTRVIVGVGEGRKTMGYLLCYPYSFDPSLDKLWNLKELARRIEETLNYENFD